MRPKRIQIRKQTVSMHDFLKHIDKGYESFWRGLVFTTADKFDKVMDLMPERGKIIRSFFGTSRTEDSVRYKWDTGETLIITLDLPGSPHLGRHYRVVCWTNDQEDNDWAGRRHFHNIDNGLPCFYGRLEMPNDD